MSKIFKTTTKGMNSLHLTAGSKCPQREPGKIRIYSMRLCPYAQRALLIASAKGIKYEVVNCHLKQKPEWLFEKNPSAKVPTLEMDTGILYESLIICDYFDEQFNQSRKLTSQDFFQKAIDKIWIENFNYTVSLYYKIIFHCENTSGKLDDSLLEKLEKFNKSLEPFETELQRRGSFYFSGLEIGMLDYMLWPWFERFPIIKMFYPNEINHSEVEKRRQNLNAWVEKMKKDPAVREIYIPPEIHFKYSESSRNGNPNYDILYEQENAKL